MKNVLADARDDKEIPIPELLSELDSGRLWK